MNEYEIHQVENNAESQAHLEANRKKFSKQCEMVHRVLLSGEKLTSRIAMIKYSIGDLHRRVGELRQWHGVKIEDKWEVGEDGKTTRNKIWWIELSKRPTKSEVVANWTKQGQINF